MTNAHSGFRSTIPARYSMSVRMAAQKGKVTQEEIGAYIGKSREAISLKLRNKSYWTVNEMELLAYLFDVSVIDMIDTDTRWTEDIDADAVRARLQAPPDFKIADTHRYRSLEQRIAV